MKNPIPLASIILLPFMTVILGSALLVACHQSPLKTQPKGKSAVFLVKASAVAEQHMKLAIPEGSLGGVYTDCMENHAEKINCLDLYNAMLTFAGSGKYPNFRHLSMADLTDGKVFEQLRDDYEEVLLTTELKDLKP
jgi:hypothetical protein